MALQPMIDDPTKNRLYIADKILYQDGIPYQKVKCIKVENSIVTFTTEWPVREMQGRVEDFKKYFREWR